MTLNFYRSLLLAGLLLASLTTVASCRQGASAAGLIIADNDVELDFPRGITFKFEAASEIPIVRAELLYEVSGIETMVMSTADVEGSDQLVIDHYVDAQINYIAPGVDILYRWRLTDQNGTVTETDPEKFLWYDDSFAWDTYESDDVTVYAYNDDVSFNRHVADVAQTAVDHLKTLYELDSVEPVRIWLYQTRADFVNILLENSEEWIGGVSIPEARTIVVKLSSGDEGELNRVIPHEVSHHLLYQATQNPFNYTATWFDEGLAVYAQLSGNEEDQALVEDAFAKESLPSVQSLIASFPTDRAATNVSYAASHMLVKFIIDTYGEDGIRAMCQAYRLGMSHDQVLMTALGVDTARLDQLWRASIAASLG
jgi:hypothetical protein